MLCPCPHARWVLARDNYPRVVKRPLPLLECRSSTCSHMLADLRSYILSAATYHPAALAVVACTETEPLYRPHPRADRLSWLPQLHRPVAVFSANQWPFCRYLGLSATQGWPCENHTSFFRGAAHDGSTALWSAGFSPKRGFPLCPRFPADENVRV